MEYVVKFSSDADKDYDKHIFAGNTSIIDKINRLKQLLSEDLRGITKRIVNLKRLKHYKNQARYSIRLNDKHRMVYVIDEKEKKVIVLELWKHYGDK